MACHLGLPGSSLVPLTHRETPFLRSKGRRHRFWSKRGLMLIFDKSVILWGGVRLSRLLASVILSMPVVSCGQDEGHVAPRPGTELPVLSADDVFGEAGAADEICVQIIDGKNTCFERTLERETRITFPVADANGLRADSALVRVWTGTPAEAEGELKVRLVSMGDGAPAVIARGHVDFMRFEAPLDETPHVGELRPTESPLLQGAADAVETDFPGHALGRQANSGDAQQLSGTTVIRVVVVFDTSVFSGPFASTHVRTNAVLAVDQANTVMRNQESGGADNIQFELAGVVAHGSLDVSHVRDIYVPLRDLKYDFEADILSWWGKAPSGLCGQASIFADGKDSGYNVVSSDCLPGSGNGSDATTFVHEMGHNFGLLHDRSNAYESPEYGRRQVGTNFGAVDTQERRLTLMSYENDLNGCSGCRYVWIYSHDDLKRTQGWPTEQPWGRDGGTNNIQTLLNNSAAVSTFRDIRWWRSDSGGRFPENWGN